MYEVSLMNLKTKEIFERRFYSEYKFRIFKNKLKHSNKLLLLAEWKYE